MVDALSDTETIVAGDKTKVAVRVFAPERTNAKITGAIDGHAERLDGEQCQCAGSTDGGFFPATKMP